MSHYAIIKGYRKDVDWYFNNNRNLIEHFKKLTFSEKGQRRYTSSYYDSYEERWFKSIKSHGISYKTWDTGTYTEWEGKVNLDILQVGTFIYVPTLDNYRKVIKVEANTDGKVTYYVDHNKEFTDNSEPSRIKAVEDWFSIEYPMYDSFNMLINHKDDNINELQVEYNEFVENRNKEKEIKEELKEKYNYEKPIHLTDSSKKDKKSFWDRIFG